MKKNRNYLKIDSPKKMSLLDLYSLAIYENEIESNNYLLGETQVEVEYEGLYFDFYLFEGSDDLEEINGAIKLAIKLGFLDEEKAMSYRQKDSFIKRHKKFKYLIEDEDELAFAEIVVCQHIDMNWYEENKNKYINVIKELFKNKPPDFESRDGYMDWEDIIWSNGLKIYFTKPFEKHELEFREKTLGIEVR